MPKEKDNDVAVLKRHCAHLMEHFDSVQIFVTRHENKHTRGMNWGDGDLYSRLGITREWIETQSEYVREHARQNSDEDDEEENEEEESCLA